MTRTPILTVVAALLLAGCGESQETPDAGPMPAAPNAPSTPVRPPLHGPAGGRDGPVVTVPEDRHDEDDTAAPAGPRYRVPTGLTGEAAIWRRRVVRLDGWTVRVASLNARTGITLLQAWPTDGSPTTARAARRAVTRIARRLGDDPDAYRVSVPMGALRNAPPATATPDPTATQRSTSMPPTTDRSDAVPRTGPAPSTAQTRSAA